MEVVNEGEVKVDEPPAYGSRVCVWVPSPPPESCVHDQTPDLSGLLRLWNGIRVTGCSCSQCGLVENNELSNTRIPLKDDRTRDRLEIKGQTSLMPLCRSGLIAFVLPDLFCGEPAPANAAAPISQRP